MEGADREICEGPQTRVRNRMKSGAAMVGGGLVLEALRAGGIRYIFGCPGSEWVCLLERLAESRREPFPAYINCRHETVAVAMAMGYARVTGRVAAVLLHDSVGPLHAAMAIRAAHRAGDPILICAGDSSGQGDYETDPVTGWIWVARLADLDGVDSLVQGYVKWSGRVDSHRDIREAVSQACQMACRPPAGPCLLAVPWQILVSAQDAPRTPSSVPPEPPSGPGPELLNRAAAVLVESKNPAIVTEFGARDPEAVSNLVRLSELLAIPVLETVDPALSNFPPDHPLYMGDRASEVLEGADAVLLIGANTPWYPPDAYPGKDAKVILIDEDPDKSRLPRWGYRTDVRLGGEMGTTLCALTDAVEALLVDSEGSGARTKARFRKWKQSHEKVLAEWSEEGRREKSGTGLTPPGFFYRLRSLLPENGLILDETVSQSSLIRRYLGRPGHYIRAGAGGLGIGLGVAAGVKLARREDPVILFLGDGTFVFNPVLAALGGCREYGLPILIVLFNNGGYGAIRNAYRKYSPHGWSVRNDTYLGADFKPGPDYVKVAEALGGLGERITEPAAIEPCFQRGLEELARGRCFLIEVVFR